MYANKVSDFYDNLDRETKKEIHIAYEIINDPLGPPTKEFIKRVLKDRYLIEKYRSSKNVEINYSYKEGIVEKCLEKLGEDKSIDFLFLVSSIFYKIIRKVSKRNQLHAIEEFKDMLFMSIHYYDKEIFTSNNFMHEVQYFYKLTKSRFVKMQ
ncbi:hypothetical protein HNR35_001124 [Borreliella spielmanii]|uniref:Uncharacterized protein n=1 Tax=Borreliella spielmanii TaxID=88916 RepID=A0ABR6P7X1_9SPIR|nr:DUF643 domain-containing protein [Borreliella spielmanii]MBB6032121.1 hypothetical protein [Borreliella spielmanii]